VRESERAAEGHLRPDRVMDAMVPEVRVAGEPRQRVAPRRGYLQVAVNVA